MDLYKILNVPKEASSDDIKKSHRKLSLKWHPDSYKGSNSKEAVERFKEVQEAYETLSDPSKRSRYDALGYTGNRPKPNKKPTETPKPKKEPEPKSKGKSAAGPDPEKRSWAKSKEKSAIEGLNYVYIERKNMGRSIQMQIKITPEIRNGGLKTIKVQKRDMCRRCIGDGEITVICPQCRGKNPEISWCHKCDGMGGVRQECDICQGEGLHGFFFDEMSISIPPNCPSGHMIQVIGGGETGGGHRCPPGNLQVVLV